MTRAELLLILGELQRHRSEQEGVEVKTAARGTPKRLYEVLSAFANRPRGGMIVFGLDEEKGFEAVGCGDIQRLQADIASLASSEMEPPLRPRFLSADVRGRQVLAVSIDEVRPEDKPCYYKPAGLQKGAYIRVGNTNRLMSDYEVFGYISARSQPTFDEQPVGDATIADLDAEALTQYIETLRRVRPRARFLLGSREDALLQLGVLRRGDGALVPTLAGLLAFGAYPQRFEPQLVITFLQFYGVTEDDSGPRGERFLDNRKFEGPLPELIEEAVRYAMGALRKASLIEGLYRREIPEYPAEAVREAVVNAVAHRDYSHYVRGSYIQLRLFADRLEVQSPGGLFGPVSLERIEEEQSTRNRTLMRLLEDLHLVENRGSGIKAMIRALRQAGLQPPVFTDRRTSFVVALRNLSLMNPEAIAWVNQFAAKKLNDRQRTALVYLRHNARMTNSDYRRLNHVDTVLSTRELRELVAEGLIEQSGTRRGASYALLAGRELPEAEVSRRVEEQVVSFVREHGSINNSECRRLLSLNLHQASTLLRRLASRGALVKLGERRWARYVLPRQ